MYKLSIYNTDRTTIMVVKIQSDFAHADDTPYLALAGGLWVSFHFFKITEIYQKRTASFCGQGGVTMDLLSWVRSVWTAAMVRLCYAPSTYPGMFYEALPLETNKDNTEWINSSANITTSLLGNDTACVGEIFINNRDRLIFVLLAFTQELFMWKWYYLPITANTRWSNIPPNISALPLDREMIYLGKMQDLCEQQRSHIFLLPCQ